MTITRAILVSLSEARSFKFMMFEPCARRDFRFSSGSPRVRRGYGECKWRSEHESAFLDPVVRRGVVVDVVRLDAQADTGVGQLGGCVAARRRVVGRVPRPGWRPQRPDQLQAL